jgi:hypothetical protein
MKRAFWPTIFLLGLPLTLALAISTLSASTISKPQVLGSTTQHIDALNLPIPEILTKIYTSDSRPLIIQKYLHDYDSPLEPYANTIVEISDKYQLDYRLLVAIAQQESNLCKKIPPESHNCWGFGIYGDLITRFDNYPQALNTVAKTLKNEYIDKGLDTPEKIMAKYTPPSLEKGGPWAKGVNIFLSELE